MPNSPIDRLIDAEVEWKPTGAAGSASDGTPYATHEGVLRICGHELKVFQLSNGMRVIDEASLAALFGATVDEFRAAMGGVRESA